MLQVLLSQAHRLRALLLLSRFVDLGPWAVHLSLSIGIFPYVQKLLQSPAVDLKPVLIFIWARILAVDKSCQVDLLRDAGYNYFAQILSPLPPPTGPITMPNDNEHRAMCAFILSILCRSFRAGQTACLAINVFDHCLARLQGNDWLLKTWSLLCIAQLWADNDEAKALFMTSQQRQNELMFSLRNTAVEVRAAALYAFGTLLGASGAQSDLSDSRGGGGTGAQLGISDLAQLDIEAGLGYACMMTVKEDASPIVRKELVVVLSCVAREWRGWMVCAAWAYFEQEALLQSDTVGDDASDVVTPALEAWASREDRSTPEQRHDATLLSSFKMVFETLLDLSVDPQTEVALMASTVVDYVVALLLDSSFCRVQGSALKKMTKARGRPRLNLRQPSTAVSELARPSAPPLSRTNSQTSILSTQPTLKRNLSVANALKTLASITGIAQSDPSPAYLPDEVESRPQLRSSASNGYHSPYPKADHKTILPDGGRSSSLGLLNAQIRQGSGLGMSRADQSTVSAANVLAALTEEDMERLRIRRVRGSQAGGDVDGRLANNGLARSSDLGLGMVAKEVKDDVLPLRSDFFDLSMRYFRDPQMKAPDTDEPGSRMWYDQQWKNERNQASAVRSTTAAASAGEQFRHGLLARD